VAGKRTMPLSILMKVLRRAGKEGQRRMSSVIIATRKDITKQIFGQREEERRERGRK
jgi:hypothetical protein